MPYLGSLAYADDPGQIIAAPDSPVPDSPVPDSPESASTAPVPTAPASAARLPAARQYNSAQRLHALWHEFTVPESVRLAVAELSDPVLLVDDLIETGWTMTIGAKLLREAGAPAVLPLALATTSG